MNIGYIIDINDVVGVEALKIPYLSGLHYLHDTAKGITPEKILHFRDDIVISNYAGQIVDKHIFFFIVKNDEKDVRAINSCISSIQEDRIHFNQDQYEIHVILNLVVDGGISLEMYQEMMPCLQDNKVCVYTWLADRYDFTGSVLIVPERRAHAIARLAWMICKHRIDLPLVQMHSDYSPIYNLFGDSCIAFDEGDRDRDIRRYYSFKSLQHLLNLSDTQLEAYLKDNVTPFIDQPKELDKRLDASSTAFLKSQRVPIEATLITEKTQGLLLKSSDEDKEYLIDATDNKLVFIDELSREQKWQLDDTDVFLRGFRSRVERGEEFQDTVTDDFLTELNHKLVVHNRVRFDAINNELSQSRKQQIEGFKDNVDKYLLKFLNNTEKSYVKLSDILTDQDVKNHFSNIDYSIAFLEYLNAGKGDYLVDQVVSSGDTNFLLIKEALEEEEKKRLQAFKDRERQIEEDYKPQGEDKPSKVKSQFESFDRQIKQQKEQIRVLNFQLEKWYDSCATPKLTARSRACIAFGSGLIASGLWLWICLTLKSYLMLFNLLGTAKLAGRFAWFGFLFLLLAGLVVGLCIVWKVIKKRKEAEKQLRRARDGKTKLMHDCMEGMKDLVEKHYRYLLSFHGLKTITELMEFVQLKIADLESFRKTLFRLLVKCKLEMAEKRPTMPADFNTTLLQDTEAKALLFGPDGKNTVPFCFSQTGITLSDTFDSYKLHKVRFDTSRFSFDFSQETEFDPISLENEVIPAREKDTEDPEIQYTPLNRLSLLPETKEGVDMRDVHQGQCGDCYFMATLASIAKMNPEYIIGKNGMVEKLGEDNRFYRVKFYNNNGDRVSVDVDNKFWNKNDRPLYAQPGLTDGAENSDSATYDPWVMLVEKAWAKANNAGYDGIEGASGEGKDRSREVEYSYAVTGKTAYYCRTQNVPSREKLHEMMKKHIVEDHLPITLYSVNESDPSFTNRDPYIVPCHAYSLKGVNEDGTFDIFNPWNFIAADEDVRGKHYEHVSIDFIKDNFDVVVFFGIKEADFSSFERNLTDNVAEKELSDSIEKVLNECFLSLHLPTQSFEGLITEEVLDISYLNASFLLNRSRLKDKRGVEGDEQEMVILEPAKDSTLANAKVKDYIASKGRLSVLQTNPREDDKKSITLLRLSPHFVLNNFNK